MTKRNTASAYLIALLFVMPWAGTNLLAEQPDVGQFIEFMHEPPPTPGLRREGSRGDEKGNS
jgi:hypothetical protein